MWRTGGRLEAITTRPVSPEDFESLFELHRRALGEYVRATWGWDEDVQRKLFRERFDPVHDQVIEHNGRDLGCIRVSRAPDEIVLARIALWPEFQNGGIGTRLIRALQEEGRSRGVPVRLSVLKANPAHLLYRRLGFEVTGEDEHRYWMEWRDASCALCSRGPDGES